jgi:hypothetical protein
MHVFPINHDLCPEKANEWRQNVACDCLWMGMIENWRMLFNVYRIFFVVAALFLSFIYYLFIYWMGSPAFCQSWPQTTILLPMIIHVAGFTDACHHTQVLVELDHTNLFFTFFFLFDCPDFCLSSNWDYRRIPPCLFYFFLRFIEIVWNSLW